MKVSRIVTAVALLAVATFTSCKKNYTCTCTTVIGTGSIDVKHSIDDAYQSDAQKSCNNYQDEANRTVPGGTTCHL